MNDADTLTMRHDVGPGDHNIITGRGEIVGRTWLSESEVERSFPGKSLSEKIRAMIAAGQYIPLPDDIIAAVALRLRQLPHQLGGNRDDVSYESMARAALGVILTRHPHPRVPALPTTIRWNDPPPGRSRGV